MNDDLKLLATRESVMEDNAILLEKLASNDPMQHKSAADAVGGYIRRRVREGSIVEKITPGVQVQDSELVPQETHDEPTILGYMQPDSPGAVAVGFNSFPATWFMRGPRYTARIQRIQSRKATQDVDKLRTYGDVDLRQIISDDMIKDLLELQDRASFGAVDLMVGSQGVTNVTTGIVQNVALSGGLTRETLTAAQSVLPSAVNHIAAKTIVMNFSTALKLQNLKFNDVGGELAQTVLRDGIAAFGDRVFGMDMIVTIKNDIVLDNTAYLFGAEKYLGVNKVLHDTTMFLDNKDYAVTFYVSKSLAVVWPNVAAQLKVSWS